MKKVEAYEASDGSVHPSKTRCAAHEIMRMVGSTEIDMESANKLVNNRGKLISILQAIDASEEKS